MNNDNVNHPAHYNTDNPQKCITIDGKVRAIVIECIDVIRNMPSWKANPIKYLWRAGLKKDADKTLIDKEIEDLKKAAWYIEDKIYELERLKNKIEDDSKYKEN